MKPKFSASFFLHRALWEWQVGEGCLAPVTQRFLTFPQMTFPRILSEKLWQVKPIWVCSKYWLSEAHLSGFTPELSSKITALQIVILLVGSQLDLVEDPLDISARFESLQWRSIPNDGVSNAINDSPVLCREVTTRCISVAEFKVLGVSFHHSIPETLMVSEATGEMAHIATLSIGLVPASPD